MDSWPVMIPAFLLVVAAVAYRIATGLLIHSGATWLSNFAPLAAIALCCAIYFPPKLKFTLPLGALLLSDLVLNYHYGASMLDGHIAGRYLALVLVGFLGVWLQRRPSFKTVLPAAIASSIMFYVVTNIFSWATDPGYAKNAAGLLQALTMGLSQYSSTPAWMFFRNSLLSDLFFTVFFVLCVNLGRNSEAASAKPALARIA
jgi:hypothetical protein